MITSNTVTLQCFNTHKQTVTLQSIVSEKLFEGAGHDGDGKGECQCKWQDDPGRVRAYIYIRVQGDLVDRDVSPARSARRIRTRSHRSGAESPMVPT